MKSGLDMDWSDWPKGVGSYLAGFLDLMQLTAFDLILARGFPGRAKYSTITVRKFESLFRLW